MKLWPTIEAKLIKGRYYLKEKNMKKTKRKYRFRSSVTGLFVTEKYAKKHPKTTEREVIK